MTPFSMEMSAAHRKFEFERAVTTAQTEGNIRRAAMEAKQRVEGAQQSAASDDHHPPRSPFAMLRRLVPTRLTRTVIQSAAPR
jgi:hypothetical protein